MPSNRWSHSRLQTYLSCPCAYKLHYLDKEPQIASDPMRDGSAFHEAIARYAEHCWRGGRKSRSTDFDEGRKIAQGYPDLEDDIVRWVENTVWEWGAILPGDTKPVEVMYNADLPSGDEFCGIVDLLQRYSGGVADDPFAESDDLWSLTDYKSGWATYPEDKAPLQLLGYAWLVQKTWPEARVFDLRIHSVRAPWSPKPWRVEGNLSWVAEKLDAIADRVRRDTEFSPSVGPACMTCNLVAACPHAQTNTLSTLSEDPVAIGRQVALLEARVKQGKALLKAAVKGRGPIPTDEPGKAWGWERTESTKPASARQGCEVIEAAGLDPWLYLGLTPAKFHDAQAAASEEAQALFERVSEVTVRNEFGIVDAPGPAPMPEPQPDPTGTFSHATEEHFNPVPTPSAMDAVRERLAERRAGEVGRLLMDGDALGGP